MCNRFGSLIVSLSLFVVSLPLYVIRGNNRCSVQCEMLVHMKFLLTDASTSLETIQIGPLPLQTNIDILVYLLLFYSDES